MRSRTSSARLTGISNLAVTARVKAGFVEGFETITYLDRLNKLLSALNVARVAARESALVKPAFPDAIGRFDIIRSFRYAVIPPEGEGPRDPPLGRKLPGVSRLSLNVTFDAGWEPYMRVIYRDIGTLLDALFCHCDGYPGSRFSAFDEYSAWVRDNELDSGLYYLDSSITLGDEHYLDRLERLQRAEKCPVTADRAIAELAIAPAHKQRALAMAEARANPGPSFFAAMRALKGFFRLAAYFPPNTPDGHVLIRFAQAVLGEFYDLNKEGIYKADPLLRGLLSDVFRDEIGWFEIDTGRPKVAAPAEFVATKVQAGIVKSYKEITHGCVVLLRVADGDKAVEHFKTYPVSRQGTPGEGGIERNVAFTYRGLQALAISSDRLDRLPQEFFEGMERRASLLGDVRTNHPDNWARPLRNWPIPTGPGPAAPTERIDLSTVHVAIQLRLVDPTTPGPDVLHDRLRAEIDKLDAATSGLKVLGFQPGWSQRVDATTTREHFGFLDGVSQPEVGHDIPAGELVLGYPNGRDGEQPREKIDELFVDGSFLVMRKLQQNVGLLNQLVPDKKLQESLMGRAKEGDALVPVTPHGSNKFDYVGDPNGLKCPFHSHVRRANPRDGRLYTPRIMRRGMSYGPPWSGPGDTVTERGIVFMAYCASIAEQFEVVQRWMAGGNSSGVSSSQSDPFLGVPEPGEKRIFRFPHGDGVTRIDLGDKPFIALKWGLYLFAPSVDALKKLSTYRTPNKPGAPAPAPAPQPELWKALLEDSSWDPSDPDRIRQRNAPAWEGVRAEPNGVLATPYGLLVGKKDGVLAVLQDDGSRFSVKGYNERLAKSIGDGFLGLDKPAHDEQAEHGVNQAIASFDQRKVFGPARAAVDGFLTTMARLAALESLAPLRVPLDLVSMSEFVLASLCTAWFGLPDKALMFAAGRSVAPKPARCPGHLLTVSRYIFGPRPNPYVKKEAEEQGQEVLDAFKKLLAQDRLGPLAKAIRQGLQHIPAVAGGDPDSIVAKIIAGVMMGFPPTVHGNFLRTMETLIRTEDLWPLQQRLLESRTGMADPFQRASDVLFGPLIDTMRKRPVPEMIWRTAADGANVGGAAPTDPDKRVVLGLASALTDPGVDHSLMFGGTYKNGPYKTLHACPGYDMAIGVLLALLSGLLEAGELRPTGSTIGLTLLPR